MHRPRQRAFSLHHSSASLASSPVSPSSSSPLVPSNKVDGPAVLLVLVLAALLWSLPRVRRTTRLTFAQITGLLFSSEGQRARGDLCLIPLFANAQSPRIPPSPQRKLASMPSRMLSKLGASQARARHSPSSSFASGPRHFVVTPTPRLDTPPVRRALLYRTDSSRNGVISLGVGRPCQSFLSSSTIRSSSRTEERRANTPRATKVERSDAGGWVMPLGQVTSDSLAARGRAASSSPFFLRIHEDEHIEPYKPWASPADVVDDFHPSFDPSIVVHEFPFPNCLSASSSTSSFGEVVTPVASPSPVSSDGTESPFALDIAFPRPPSTVPANQIGHARHPSKVHQPVPRLASFGSPLLAPDWKTLTSYFPVEDDFPTQHNAEDASSDAEKGQADAIATTAEERATEEAVFALLRM